MKKITTILFLGFALGAKAQIPQPDPDTTAKHFLIVASIGNLQEASAGKQAFQKAGNAEIKAFGQMMAKDHQAAEEKLLALAKAKKIDLPSAATGSIKPDFNLEKAGSAFDRLYLHAMTSAHNNAIQTFQNYAVTGKDPEVRAFAQQSLPVLKKHLVEARALEEKLK